MENKIINVKKENIFYRAYQTIAYDANNRKKPFVCTNIINKKGKTVADAFNISAKAMAQNLKETPGLFFSLPHEVFEEHFSKPVVDKVVDNAFGNKTDLERFLDGVKEGMLEFVEKVEGSLENLNNDVEEFQAKILEKVDFEKKNLQERLVAKLKIKTFSLD